ncbi:hypothetical protein Tco_0604220 [Tanacetum coccineum]
MIPSIPISGSISPEGFLPSILLLVNHALLSDPLTFGLCWWLPPKFEASWQGYGMIHNDGDGDNDAYDDDIDDDEREIIEEEDGGWICFLGGNNSSGTKKYRGSNSSDGGNTGDGVKIAGGVIESCGEIEMLPDEAGK